ncbi:MAG: hypothetical protein IJ637_04250 [Prevotella sp.]|nr:hypothetical protein [Prevotella sp.]
MNKHIDTNTDRHQTDDGFADDLREALRRREARRPQSEVPADFCDRVMQEIEVSTRIVEDTEPAPTAKRWRIAATALAAAASIALIIMLAWPHTQPLPSPADESMEPTVAQNIREADVPLASFLPVTGQQTAMATEQQPAMATRPQPKQPASQLPSSTAMQPAPAAQLAQAADDAPATPTATDSLEYYISKVEQQLDKIRDSCYEARIGRLIRVDARLQQLVTQLIADGIMADTLFMTAKAE